MPRGTAARRARRESEWPRRPLPTVTARASTHRWGSARAETGLGGARREESKLVREPKRPARLAAHGAAAPPPHGLLLRDHPRMTPLRLPRTARGALSHVERLFRERNPHVALCRPLPRELVARSRARSRRCTAYALDISGAPTARLAALETAAAAHGAARHDAAEYKRAETRRRSRQRSNAHVSAQLRRGAASERCASTTLARAAVAGDVSAAAARAPLLCACGRCGPLTDARGASSGRAPPRRRRAAAGRVLLHVAN